MFKTVRIAILGGCVLALGDTAHANTVRHNGVLIFGDNFEDQIVGNNPSIFRRASVSMLLVLLCRQLPQI